MVISRMLDTTVKWCFVFFFFPLQQALNEENLRKQEESVQKQEAMRKGTCLTTVTEKARCRYTVKCW